MAGRQAKILSSGTLRRALAQAGRSGTPARDRVIILLSARAGLRAAEIAGLQWDMVLNSRGRLGSSIEVRDKIAKYGSGRRIPIHPELARALGRLKTGSQPCGSVIRSLRGGHMRPGSIVNWFRQLFRSIGADGCSSHSGRRAFITTTARRAGRVGASIRDVQLLAGHRSIETTQSYIDGDSDAQRRLVRSI